MERSRIVLWMVVLAAAGVIIWQVGFETPVASLRGIEGKAGAQPSRRVLSPNEPNKAAAPGKADPNALQSPATTTDPNKPAGGDPNRPEAKPNDVSGQTAKAEESKPGDAKPEEAKTPEDPNDPLEAVNLKDVEMKNIIEKIAQWTGKAVIPSDEAMKQKITIYAPEKLPRSKALLKIYSALRMKGFTPEEVDDTIFLKPLSDVKLGSHPIVRADQPLAAFENPNQIVQKFFKLADYPPSQMGAIVKPLVSEFGHVGADESTGTLLVIDSVANLMRIENIIAQFDVPDAGRMITEIFEIHSGDPTEMVQLLRMLLGGPADSRRGGQLRSGSIARPSSQSSGGSGKTASSVVISAGDTPIILIPEPKRKWIIARGSSESIRQIGEWIQKMDRDEPIKAEYETVSIVYADTEEVARRIQQSLEQMPGTELRPNVLVQSLSQSRQIMIFGRADLREMVKKLIAEVDIMPGQFLTEVFKLKHADPDQIKSNLEGLYDSESGSSYSYGYRSSRSRYIQPSETVKAISYPSMGQVTVIASAENMAKIRKQIEEWDVPLDVEQVKPRIIELKNSDPVQMAALLRKLFSQESDSSRSLLRMLFYGDEMDQRQKIVGPLYGQLTFEEVAGTKKIIVISKLPQAYAVIEQLIYELDRQAMAEIPRVVQIKYADTEDLAERLNAMFNEPGTNARVRRTTQGIGQYSMEDAGGTQNQSSGRNNNQGGNNNPAQSNASEYTPWWSSGGSRPRVGEEPISNVIGRVRFVPDPRSKSILVLAPPEFQSSIEETIRGLDVPGKQVMVKAIVVEIDHQDLTSLGLQLSSNPAGTFAVGENSVAALSKLTYLEERGSATIEVGTSITTLLDFLVKKVDAQILNQQSLWTEDNEEASFFKGQMVAFQTNASTSETGGRVTQSFEYQKVGMTLAVRPSITPDKNVDMIVTVLLSDLTGDSINGQPVRRVMESTTNMIVQDGQTLMLGGILFQTDTKIQRKVPLFGDLPLLGGLFRHNDVTQANNELIVFITPYVVDDGATLSPETAEQIEKPKEKLETIQGELNQMSEELERSFKEE
ncbi:MAG TPA: secretin N-terminal domain-containing protein [Sedimentisphaerales bacterium]|nr:secretin N-terminal domain-containing protein [Sedimentisphaerales bacterium]